MPDTEATSFLQLPRDVVSPILQLCGPRGKWALFATCHSTRRLLLQTVSGISASMKLSQLPRKPRPPLLMRDLDGCWLSNVRLQLTHVSFRSLLRCSNQLNGVHHLTLVGSATACRKVHDSGSDVCVYPQAVPIVTCLCRLCTKQRAATSYTSGFPWSGFGSGQH
jgi:hypothetical protein